MKQVITAAVLRELLLQSNHSSIVFDAEEQNWYCPLTPEKFMLSFPSAMVTDSPDALYLKCDAGTVWFRHIKYIEADLTKDNKLLSFTLYCKDYLKKSSDIPIFFGLK